MRRERDQQVGLGLAPAARPVAARAAASRSASAASAARRCVDEQRVDAPRAVVRIQVGERETVGEREVRHVDWMARKVAHGCAGKAVHFTRFGTGDARTPRHKLSTVRPGTRSQALRSHDAPHRRSAAAPAGTAGDMRGRTGPCARPCGASHRDASGRSLRLEIACPRFARSCRRLALSAALPAAAQTIKLGELNSYKVFPAFLEPYKKGMELALDEVNAARRRARPEDRDRVARRQRHAGRRRARGRGAGVAREGRDADGHVRRPTSASRSPISPSSARCRSSPRSR